MTFRRVHRPTRNERLVPTSRWDDPFLARSLRRNLTAALILSLLATLFRAANL